MADMGKFNEELIKAGIVLAMDGLHPSSKGARVKFSGKSRTVVDGPSPKPRSSSPASGSGRSSPLKRPSSGSSAAQPHAGDSEIEIRQVFEMEDFAPILSEEQIQHNVRRRAELSNQTANK